MYFFFRTFGVLNQMLIGQLDPLTEQQVLGIYSLQHSSNQAEEALSQGLEQLQQSLVDTIAAGQVIDQSMQQMAVALGKLSNLEGFVRQVIIIKPIIKILVSFSSLI
jgi:transcription factor TGA